MQYPSLIQSFWESPTRAVLLFDADWSVRTIPHIKWIHTGEQAVQLAAIPPKQLCDYQSYYIDEKQIVFVLSLCTYPDLEKIEHPIYLAGPFNQWNPFQDKRWRFKVVCHAGSKRWELAMAKDAFNIDKPFAFKAVTQQGVWLSPPLRAWNTIQDEQGNLNSLMQPSCTGKQGFYLNAPFKYEAFSPIHIEYAGQTYPIDPLPALMKLDIDGPLGAIVHQNSTSFRLFAPRASHVWLDYHLESHAPFTQKMEKIQDGIWEWTIPENLHGCCYAYRLESPQDPTLGCDINQRLIDPYAKAIHPVYNSGIVIDEKHIEKPKKSYQPPAWQNLVILEGHVRDLLAHAPIDLKPEQRKTLSGLTSWVKQPSHYLRDLGVNALELQPIQAFDGPLDAYHWGYMPIHYFSPAPAYLEKTDGLSQIREVQTCIQAFHTAGIAVIVDVVYNHAGQPNPFYAIDKYYYLRSDIKGHLENYSGCGNDLRTEAPMLQKLIIDSLIHWVKWYDVDGFRFDLAELLGMHLLKKIEQALKVIKPGIILIAEPWSFRGHIADQLKATTWAYWNDQYRDGIAQYVCGQADAGCLNFLLRGSCCAGMPTHSINYVESHDDRTWIDKITQNADHNGSHPTWEDIRRTHLMIAILMASLGIPMLSAGQDFMRSKGGLSNTYQHAQANALDYERAEQYVHTQNYVQAWIQLRHHRTLEPFFKHLIIPKDTYFHPFYHHEQKALGLLYNANGSLGKKRLLLAINPHSYAIELELPGIDPHAYHLIADHERVDPHGLPLPHFRWTNGKLHMPELTLGLFLHI